MKKTFFLTILTTTLLTVVTLGQSIKIGVGGGLTALTGDNTLTEDNALNLNSGIHYGGKLVVGLPLLPIQFTASAYNNPLSSEYTAENTNTTVKTETTFLSAGIGAELTLLPGPLQPYLAGNLLYTKFGETTVSGEGYSHTTDAAENGLGVGVGAGLYFKLLPIIDIDLSAHYNMNTLLSDGEAMNSTHVRLNILFSIL